MKFLLLGNLEIKQANGDSASVTRLRQLQVLANLLAMPNTVISTERLMRGLWEDRAPASARGNLKSYVCDLRKVLVRLDVPIETMNGGYRIVLDPADVDVTLFDQELTLANRALATGNHLPAMEHLRTALGYWRGPALDGLADSSHLLGAVAAKLNDKRLTAVQQFAGTCLRIGMQSMVLPYLRDAIAEDPLREKLTGYLMLALYREGRRAEALASYQTLRTALVSDVGVEPCREIEILHQQILTDDPLLVRREMLDSLDSSVVAAA
ncbi:AfsR/SARP family transcriptional regulator [Streptomyces sp. SS7]|uniref:AfsR/SARP family transcriptional regulator n=1 Tax=Streptomyces sp. SS7 TaxID=3108485 RepID=UPI0030EC4523